MQTWGQESSGEADGVEHPELEDIAAYAEGKLAPAERAHIAEHLDSCQDCFDVFAEVVRMTADDPEASEEASTADSPLPFEPRHPAGDLPAPGAVPRAPRRPRRFWYQTAAVAAVLLVAVGLGLTYRTLERRPEISVAEWIPAAHGFSSRPWEGDTLRGADDKTGDIGSGFEHESFQIGILDVDLQLTLAEEDLPRAAETCRRIANVLEAALFMDDEIELFRELRTSLDAGRIPPGAREQATAALEPAAPDRLHLDFGRWAEIGRLWAVAGRQSVFRDRAYRRFLNRLLEDPASLAEPAEGAAEEVTLDPEVVRHLHEIESVLATDGDLGRAELGRIERALDGIIHFYHQPVES